MTNFRTRPDGTVYPIRGGGVGGVLVAIAAVAVLGGGGALGLGVLGKVEAVQGSGDIRPLPVEAILGLTQVSFTGHHYHSRPDKTARVIAEADIATGHIDGPVLDAFAEIASYLPLK